MRLRVRIPLRAGIAVSCVCCVLSGRGLCDGLTARSDESYRVWCVWVRSWSLDNGEAVAHWGLLRRGKRKRGFVLSPSHCCIRSQDCSVSSGTLFFLWFQNSKLIKNLCLVFRVCAGMKQNSWLLYNNFLLLMSLRFKELIRIRLWRSGSLLLRL